MCTAADTPSTTTSSSQDFDKTDATTPDKKPMDTRDEGDGEPKSFGIDTDHYQPDRRLNKADTASVMVVLGALAIGSLLGTIISALAFVVAILGAVIAALCCHDSKAGDAARKVGGSGAEVILAVVKKGRELNEYFKIGDKAEQLTKDTWARIQKMDERRGISDNIKARTASLWSYIEQRTRPRQSSVEQGMPEPAAGNDETELLLPGQRTHTTEH